ncbi:adenylyltransferase/cytidyltransferase family protein [Actinoplanes sp. NPDC049265]|uniref:adenylyltransferase/cytidyltransferase family protein n=1 Tax=Actinoplanes sp. NPDC049265 TaxID=3363902 RepID=UPI003720E6CF
MSTSDVADGKKTELSTAKTLSTAAMTEFRAPLRERGLTVGLCHGCFDILHNGHVFYLTQAAGLCDVLVVSITSARHVNKGPGRPVFGDEARAAVLSALSMVDRVVTNDHPTAVPVIEALQPDFYFKGADYAGNDDSRLREEVEVLQQYGGALVLTDGAVLDSSSRAARVLQECRTHA